jgi:hypothetical protein
MIKYCIPVFALLVHHSILVAMETEKKHKKVYKPLSVTMLTTQKEILTPISLNVQSDSAQQQPAIKHSSSKEYVYPTVRLTKKQLHQKKSFKALADECRGRCNQLQYKMLAEANPLLRRRLAHAAQVTKKFYTDFLVEERRNSILDLASSSLYFNIEGYMQELECDFNALEQSCLTLNNDI